MSQNNDAIRAKVKNFLDSHRKAVFSILDDQGLPTTTLMLYAIDDDLNVFFGTRRKFAKYENIRKTPVVSLSVIEEDTDPHKVVDVRGDVVEIPEEDISETRDFFKSKNPSDLYVDREDDFTMFKLKPHFIRWLDAESGELEMVDVDL